MNTPSGRISFVMCAKNNDVSGVNSEGLRRNGHPAAYACVLFCVREWVFERGCSSVVRFVQIFSNS